MKKILFFLIAVSLLSWSADATTTTLLSDSFSDGDYTNNPTWSLDAGNVYIINQKLTSENVAQANNRISASTGMSIPESNMTYRLRFSLNGTVSDDIDYVYFDLRNAGYSTYLELYLYRPYGTSEIYLEIESNNESYQQADSANIIGLINDGVAHDYELRYNSTTNVVNILLDNSIVVSLNNTNSLDFSNVSLNMRNNTGNYFFVDDIIFEKTDALPEPDSIQSMNSSWPKFRHDLNNTGQSPYTSYSNGGVKWIITNLSYTTYTNPSVIIDSEGIIYSTSYNNNIYAFYPNGSLKWNYTTSDTFYQSNPVIDSNGTIYAGNDAGIFYAVYPNGTLKWTHNAGAGIEASPSINGDIYFGDINGVFHAVRSDGSSNWTYTTNTANENVATTPAIGSDGTIYIGGIDNTGNYTLFALTRAGALDWSYHMGTAGTSYYSSPAIGSDGTIYTGINNVGGGNGKLYAINPNGTLKWAYDTGTSANIVSSPAVSSDDGTIYFGGYDGYLYAINPDGTLKWKYNNSDYIYSSPAIDSNGVVYFTNKSGYTIALNSDGSLKWEYEMGGSFSTSSPVIGSDGVIYVEADGDNKLYAFDSQAPFGFDPSGYVKDVTGAPVDGVLVTLYNSSYIVNSTSDVTGYWNVDIFEDGYYSVVAQKAGYSIYYDTAYFVIGGMNYNITLTKDITTENRVMYYPHNVKFYVMDLWQVPIEGVTVTAVGTTMTLANTSWLQGLFGVNYQQYNLVNTTMTGVTGTDGAIDFVMIEPVRYEMHVTQPSMGINQTYYVYPKSDTYWFVVSRTSNSWFTGTNNTDELSAINVTVATSVIDATTANITVTYSDSTAQTSNLVMYLNTTVATDPLNQTVLQAQSGGSSSTYTKTFTVTNYACVNYIVNVYSTVTSFGNIKRSFGVSFPNSCSPAPGLSSTLLFYFGMAFLLFIGGMAGATSHVQISGVVVVLGWILQGWGWISNAGVNVTGGLTLATVVVAVMMLNERSKSEGMT